MERVKALQVWGLIFGEKLAHGNLSKIMVCHPNNVLLPQIKG